MCDAVLPRWGRKLFIHTHIPFCTNCCRKGGPSQGPELGSCLRLGNELSEETHVLTKQEPLLGKAPGWRAVGKGTQEDYPASGSKSRGSW